MHNNYYFLRQLTPALEKVIRLSVVSECFSQNKEELVIRFERIGFTFFYQGKFVAIFFMFVISGKFSPRQKK